MDSDCLAFERWFNSGLSQSFFFLNRERIYSGVWKYLANVVGAEAVKGAESQIGNVIH